MTQEVPIIVDLVSGDTAPDLIVRFVGLNVSTGYSSIVMNMRKQDATVIQRTAVPSVTDNEVVSVTWQTGDLVVGRHQAEFEFTTLGGSVFTLPRKYALTFVVREQLG